MSQATEHKLVLFPIGEGADTKREAAAMDFFYGVKGILPLIGIIFAAVAITNDDTLTRVILGLLAVGIAVGSAWDPVARFIQRNLRSRK